MAELRTKSISIAVIGVGGVGKCFLSQLSAFITRLSSSKTSPIQLSVIYAATSKHALYTPSSSTTTSTSASSHAPMPLCPLPSFLSRLSSSPLPPLPLPSLVDHLAEHLSASSGGGGGGAHRVVLVDLTSAQALAELYPALLARGIDVVAANKKAFSGDLALWRALEPYTAATAFSSASSPAAASSGARVYHEASVGAGLPVLSTLRELLATGDAVTRIEGVFSGTMSFLFNAFAPVADGEGGSDSDSNNNNTNTNTSTNGGDNNGHGDGGRGATGRWSAAVARARQLGYTEPDPRDDLNGLDVARKLAILGRIAGLPVAAPRAAAAGAGGAATSSFPVQSLVPAALAADPAVASGDAFMARLPAFDADMDRVRADAARAGKVVRYVASVDVTAGGAGAGGQLRVGMEMLDRAHPIAALRGSDNIISFYTRRYGPERPLTVQGAGAGGEVTAMGVMGDLLRIVDRL